jgi:hypothetical protein
MLKEISTTFFAKGGEYEVLPFCKGELEPALVRLKRLLNKRTEEVSEFRPQLTLMVNGLGQVGFSYNGIVIYSM